MVKYEKENRFRSSLKEGLSYISNVISAKLFNQIIGSTQRVIDNIEDRIMKIQKNLLRKILIVQVFWLGIVLLIFALFFFIKDFFDWNNSISFLFIGIIVFIIALVLQFGEQNK
ncbi:hypothetical protein COU54_01705 [Candidatus Pacearchaeota archaeon CG10_big_fil_rev_8_21_14_0_10_31_24]|nr:MAG: hypothetical protein COU54_01705 [Candidatus Pacearchaeota archaeon CG10_big_fil_rev_8_21_14_0_10_31_24]